MEQTKPEIHIVIENNEAVTTSRNVAENFNKKHRGVLRDIRNLTAQNGATRNMFFETTYKNSRGQEYPEFLINRDGFTLLAMGFTGKRAIDFKLAYIEQFNKMEEHIKQQLDTSQLSPELQMFNKMFNSLAKQEIAFKEEREKREQLENKVDGITDLMTLDTKDWRKEVNAIIRSIAVKQSGFEKYSEIRNESYQRLENKARCNLNIRLENRKKNMIAQGMGKTAVKRLNKLDVIAEDHRLKEIYVSVVKDMAIKYGIWEEQ